MYAEGFTYHVVERVSKMNCAEGAVDDLLSGSFCGGLPGRCELGCAIKVSIKPRLIKNVKVLSVRPK